MNHTVVMLCRTVRLGRVGVALAALLFTGSAYGALTPLQTLDFGSQGSVNDFDSDNPPDGFSWILSSSPLTGFTQFNPALGTLNAVLITVEVDAGWYLSLNADDVIDPGQEHSVEFYLDIVFDAGVFYLPTNSSSLVNGAVDSSENGPGLSAYDAGADPLSDSTSGGFGDFLLYGTSTIGSILSSDTLFFTDDFVGLGAVEGLVVGILIPASGEEWVLENTSGATANLEAELLSGQVTFQYDYTPIPEPTSLALMALAGTFLLRRRA